MKEYLVRRATADVTTRLADSRDQLPRETPAQAALPRPAGSPEPGETPQLVVPPVLVDDPLWSGADWLDVSEFRPESSAHRPRTRARLLHTGDRLLGLFSVDDRYVRCVRGRFQDPVYEDSCVEVFLQPRPDRGYLNFEMNCGGALLATHITDHRRVPGGFAAFTRLTGADARAVAIRSTLPPRIDPEIEEPVSWLLSFEIPVALLEQYVGPIGALSGQTWRANLFKCGDRTSHPHWASWSPVDALNFHRPDCFGALRFE